MVLKEGQRGKVREQQELNRKFKADIDKLNEEKKSIQELWVSPEEMEKIKKNEKDYKNTIKTLNEELNRKKEIITNLKSKEEIKQSQNSMMMSKIENVRKAYFPNPSYNFRKKMKVRN